MFITTSVVVLFILQSTRSLSPSLKLCKMPVKDQSCALICETTDFEIPVTFSHPAGNGVGSCISAYKCNSTIKGYAMTQRVKNARHITELQIDNLDMERDQGRWICSYGILASASMYLNVLAANITVTSTNRHTQNITITCSCFCLNSLKEMSMELAVFDEGQAIANSSGPMEEKLDSNKSCLANDVTGFRVFTLNKEKISGNFISIKCVCMHLALGYEEKTSTNYTVHGLRGSFQNSLEPLPTAWKIMIALTSYLVLLVILTAVLSWCRKKLQSKTNLRNCPEENLSEDVMEPLNKGTEHLETVNSIEEFPSCLWETDDQGLKYIEMGCIRIKLWKPRWIAVGLIACTAIMIILLVIAVIIKFDNPASEVVLILFVSLLSSSIPPTTLNVFLYLANSKRRKESIGKAIRSEVNHGFVETKAFLDGQKKLEKLHILIFKGVHGCGKTFNSKRMTDQWHQQGYRIEKLCDLNDWDNIVEPNDKLLVLIETGTLHIHKMSLNDTFLKKVLQCVTNRRGKLKVIFTWAMSILHNLDQYCDWAKLDNVFDENNIINFSSEDYKLTEEEKTEILTLHCQIGETGHHVGFSETNKVQISEKIFHEIMQIETLFGFPLYCAHFPQNVNLGARYFSLPPVFFIDELHKLKNSGDDFMEKKYQILNSVAFKTYDVISKNGYTEATKALAESFIKKGENGHYIFQNEAVESAVCLSVAQKDPTTVLEKCSWRFIQNYVKSKDSICKDEGLFLKLDQHTWRVLKHRFLESLNDGDLNVTEHFTYIAQVGKTFLRKLFDEIKQSKYDILVSVSCNDKDGIFTKACTNGNSVLTQMLWKFYEEDISFEILKHCQSITTINEEILQEWVEEKKQMNDKSKRRKTHI